LAETPIENPNVRDPRIRIGIAAAVFIIACALAAIAPLSASGDDPNPVWWSITPPLLAIVAAIATGRILPSLTGGILLGGLLIAIGPAERSVVLAPVTGVWESLTLAAGALGDLGNIRVIVFVTLILTTVTVIGASGGLTGLVLWLEKFARGRRSTQFITAIMGILLFIDDYANAMIVGSTMRRPSDAHRISREKLAFIVDATSAPIAGIAFVSTWVGYEIGLFDDLSQSLALGREGIELLFQALPYRFYCIFLIAFVFIQIALRREFGAMHRAESAAITNEALPEIVSTEPETGEARAAAALLPIGLLLGLVAGGVWIEGGGPALLREDVLSLVRVSAWQSIVANAGSFSMWLVIGGTAGLVTALACARFLGKLDFAAIRAAVFSGILRSVFPCSVLVCAWSLKGACAALGTDDFLVALMADQVPPMLFAAIVFVLASATAFSTGTSYGTMGILLPTATPVAYALEGGELGIVTIATLAAVLDGAIFGDHCSPISDTTIMSSAGSGCDHIRHVQTQLPYALAVAGIALVCGYAATGFGLWPIASYGAALIAIPALILTLGKRLE
jgi:Na+/H+ antiporter NhaC